MFKRFTTLILIFSSLSAYAQVNVNNMADNTTVSIDNNTEYDGLNYTDEIEDPDEAGVPMPNVGIREEEPIVEVVEGVGRLLYSNAPFYSAPRKTSQLIRRSSGAEKVILIGEKGEWFKVVMYNNQEAFIEKKYVKHTKRFADESIVTNSRNTKMDKKITIEIRTLIDKFNMELASSQYVSKYQTRPMIEYVKAKIADDTMYLEFKYYCADKSGKPIPSYKENDLAGYVKELMSLVLGRAVMSRTLKYEIAVNVPVFDEAGEVLNFDSNYTTIMLSLNDVDIEKIRKKNISIIDLADSTLKKEDLFKTFPK